jgi:hypothetical protein
LTASLISYSALVILLVGVILIGYRDRMRIKRIPGEQNRDVYQIKSILFLVVTLVLSFLFVYHRAYDQPLLFLVVAFAIAFLPDIDDQNLAWIFLLIVVYVNVLFLVPPSIMELVLPHLTRRIVETAFVTGALVLLLAASIWVLVWVSRQDGDDTPKSDAAVLGASD